MNTLSSSVGLFYETPTVEVVDIRPQIILAASGDFVYSIYYGDSGYAGTINGEYVEGGDF